MPLAHLKYLSLVFLSAVLLLSPSSWSEEEKQETPQETINIGDCATPPPGMVCISGGQVIVGNDTGPQNEQPRQTMTLSTFYMDKYEVTISEYDRCVKAGFCPDRLNKNQNIMRPFVGQDQPAVPMDWYRAERYCAWSGKRLPTEWEWEKAARGPHGDTYPWGNDPPSCSKAVYRECAPKGCKPYPGKTWEWDCVEHATKPVGSFPAGHYGLFDMAGNGFEWTATWSAPSAKSCGTKCQGKDPQGPCDGAFPCAGYSRKTLKGGSWYWPMDMMRGAFRRPEVLDTVGHRLSFRCASSTPYLTSYPPKTIREPLPSLTVPDPPKDAEKSIASRIDQDFIEIKKPCEKAGRAFLDCRDPSHYVKTNEPRQYLWAPYIANLGGGFVGVAGDANYSLIAAARSRWAWLVDYDAVVVEMHQVQKALILAAETPDDFVAFYAPGAQNKALAAIRQTFKNSPELENYLELYTIYRSVMYPYFKNLLIPNIKAPNFGWLANKENYTYIRTLFLQGRIIPLKGDLLAKRTMRSVAKAARFLRVPIRIYYPSNAPECWKLTDDYRENVRHLPMDEQSVVLQTFSGLKSGFGQKEYWHYNIQSGLQQQQRLGLKGYAAAKQLVYERIATEDPDLTIIGLPGDGPLP